MSLSTTWRNNRHGFKRSDRLSAHHHIIVSGLMPTSVSAFLSAIQCENTLVRSRRK
ncbi:hypothetical protein [uncultured Nostoc sp.]|uniref:hypothetical protein n=1 Tax=uncultured Nostoc sp. TaxID=340711 RepID=UPI0035CC35B5